MLHRVGVACLAFTLLWASTGHAQEPVSGYVPPHDPANDYLEAIDRIEADYGPYATELSDLYLGLGQALLDRMEFEKARDAFNRGVMVVRVNAGPNSPQQTDHLYLIANIETVLGNGEAADAALNNIYFINTEQYGEDSLEMLPVIERIYDWYLVTRPFGSDDSNYEDHRRAVELSEQMLEISEKHYGPEHSETTAAWRRLGEAQFRTVLWMIDQGVELTLDSRMELLNSTIYAASGEMESIGDHYSEGRKALDNYLEAIEKDASRAPPEFAEICADLADWYLAVGKYRNARLLYERGYAALTQSGDHAESAERYMGEPEPVHFFSPPPDFLEDREEPLPELKLDIAMTVTTRGSVRGASITDAPQDLAEEVQDEILNMVRKTPFRPAMKSGEIVTTEGFSWPLVILPPDPVALSPEQAGSG